MTLEHAIKNAKNNNRDGVCQTSWNDHMMLIVPKDAQPLYFYDDRTEEYVKKHKHPPYWNPTQEELLADDWVSCNLEDIQRGKVIKIKTFKNDDNNLSGINVSFLYDVNNTEMLSILLILARIFYSIDLSVSNHRVCLICSESLVHTTAQNLEKLFEDLVEKFNLIVEFAAE